jgi:hypothetical protein
MREDRCWVNTLPILPPQLLSIHTVHFLGKCELGPVLFCSVLSCFVFNKASQGRQASQATPVRSPTLTLPMNTSHE